MRWERLNTLSGGRVSWLCARTLVDGDPIGNMLDNVLGAMLGDALGEVELNIEGKIEGSALGFLLGIVDGPHAGICWGQRNRRG